MSREVIIRIQTPDGMKRITVPSTASLKDLYDVAYKTMNLLDYGFSLFSDKGCSKELRSSRSVTLTNSNLNHGDVVFFKQMAGSSSQSTPSSSSSSNPETPVPVKKVAMSVTEDAVDIELVKLDGTIKRKKDDKLCRHTSSNRCVHCTPLEPYDEGYLKEQKIKHLSFHSYLRKMTSGVDKGKYVAFDDINCKIKAGCREHPPWPKGICSKCQPSAITLNRQTYRHVDNVMFENNGIVDEFLNYWRSTGHQRIGFLYGTHEVTTDVPLGIRARIVAIYEPPQESSRNGIKLLEDPQDAEVQEMAAELGFKKVGWIFTDLLNHETISGKVKHLRGIETFFLTAKECILAGHFQNLHPNPCNRSSNGFFGSKFVTICVTGDKENQIHMEGYQVSAQCMALVRDNCLLPTKDAPELGYVRESTDKQYVPDVFYKDKDVYLNEVQKLARPLPVEYLLVDLPTSSPLVPLYTFPAQEHPFPVENRAMIDGKLQDHAALHRYMQRFTSSDYLTAMSNFHVLLYLYGLNAFGTEMKTLMPPLLKAVKEKDAASVGQFMRTESWTTFEHCLVASGGHEHENHLPSSVVDVGADWTCNHCTYINNGGAQVCEMCQLPR